MNFVQLEKELIDLIDTDGFLSVRVKRLYVKYSKARKNKELDMILNGQWYGELIDTCVSPEGYSEND